MKLAITQIVLGLLVVVSFLCPAPCSKIILGVAVIGVGIAQLLRARGE
jgi:uncharacterized membrane protein HdeD (DUF308 family)